MRTLYIGIRLVLIRIFFQIFYQIKPTYSLVLNIQNNYNDKFSSTDTKWYIYPRSVVTEETNKDRVKSSSWNFF